MTAWLPDVVPDQTIESVWGNTIRDRTVTPFANAAARTAAIPAPDVGMVTYLSDTGALEIWTDRVTPPAWRPPWGAGWGLVVARSNTGTGTFPAGTTLGVVGGSQLALPVAGRRYHCHCHLVNVSTFGDVTYYLQDNATVPAVYAGAVRAIIGVAGSAGRQTLNLDGIVTTTVAGQNAQVLVTAASANVTLEVGEKWAYDIGPA